MKNSTTFLLPEWWEILLAYKLPKRMMPRDVPTRWNSTFDMLEFAIQYRVAIDAMTADRDFGLREYELTPTEWNIAIELQHVLKVSGDIPLLYVGLFSLFRPDIQRSDFVFLA